MGSSPKTRYSKKKQLPESIRAVLQHVCTKFQVSTNFLFSPLFSCIFRGGLVLGCKLARKKKERYQATTFVSGSFYESSCRPVRCRAMERCTVQVRVIGSKTTNTFQEISVRPCKFASFSFFEETGMKSNKPRPTNLLSPPRTYRSNRKN